MLKSITQFKTINQDFECIFNFEQNCPIPIAKEAIFQALKWLGQVEDHAKAIQEQQKAAEIKTDLPVTDEVNEDPKLAA